MSYHPMDAEQAFQKWLNAGESRNKANYLSVSDIRIKDGPFLATVMETHAYTGHHSVQALGAGAKMPAFPMCDLGCHVIGTRNHVSYPVGTPVLCISTDRNYAIIVGAVPAPTMSQYMQVISDFMVTGAQVGYTHDSVHHYMETVDAKTKGGIFNQSSGAPYDLLPGDHVVTNEFGVGYGSGKFRTWMTAGDVCKMEFYWLDYLARLYAWNYEFFNSVSEERMFNDEGESHCTKFIALYPWEAMGMADNEDFYEDKSGKLIKGNTDGKYEPQEVDQIGIFRHQIYRGYLGDCERELIMVPAEITSPHTLSAQDNLPGVLEITKNSDGQYSLRSAKGISLEKYIRIPVPKQTAFPDDNPDNSDDQSGDYVASDKFGTERNKHLKTAWTYGEETPGIRAAQAWDFHAYMSNFYGLTTLANHEKDWHVPEEGEINLGASAVYQKGYDQLASSFALDLPEIAKLYVDHRTEEVNYYESRSFIDLHDDGSITIEDGYGSAIVMSGGNIYLQAPGDIWTMPGRSAVTWAPHDFIARAGNSADITAAKKDIRLKAENNLHMLAGNSGDSGGVYIECRNENTSDFDFNDKEGEDVRSSGIVLNAKSGPVMCYGEQMYFRTGVENPGSSNRIVFDAGKGEADCTFAGDNVELIAQSSVITSIGTTLDDPQDDATTLMMRDNLVMLYGPNLTNVSLAAGLTLVHPDRPGKSNLMIDGDIFSAGKAIFKETLLAKQLAQGTDSMFVAPAKESFDEAVEIIGDNISTIGLGVPKGKDVVDSKVETYNALLYETNRPGNDEFMESFKFSLRNDDQYGVGNDFIIYESAWQRMGHHYGGADVLWDEPVVDGPRGETLPHPGKAKWKDEECFGEVTNNKAFDADKGVAQTRDIIQTDGNAAFKKTLESGYKIVKQ